jgi:hypothetical protein
MSKAFTKGQKVTLIGSWDNKGSVYFSQAVVHSCGKKQMILTDETTGEEIGRHFRPAVGSLDTVTSFNWEGTFDRLSDDDAAALCLSAGAAVIVAVKAEIANVRRHSGDANYRWEEIEALHEPRALKR